jgi:hypothetical protein
LQRALVERETIEMGDNAAINANKPIGECREQPRGKNRSKKG